MEELVPEFNKADHNISEKNAEAVAFPKASNEHNQILYHYTDADGLLGILKPEAPELWFSRFDCLNDKSEGQDIVEQFKTACGVLLKSLESDKKLIRSIMKCTPDDRFLIPYNYRGVNNEPLINDDDLYSRQPFVKESFFETEVFICCFSSRNNLLPMWNSYSRGKAYQGYCIGFYSEMFNTFMRFAYNSDGKRIDGCNMRSALKTQAKRSEFW